MTTHDRLHQIKTVLDTDYADYGGKVERWSKPNESYPDCSTGCRFFAPLEGDLGADWGVCLNPKAGRFGLLTFEHQAGFDCYSEK